MSQPGARSAFGITCTRSGRSAGTVVTTESRTPLDTAVMASAELSIRIVTRLNGNGTSRVPCTLIASGSGARSWRRHTKKMLKSIP